MTCFVLPSRGSGVLMETKGYQGLLLIEYRTEALALSEHELLKLRSSPGTVPTIVTPGLPDHYT